MNTYDLGHGQRITYYGDEDERILPKPPARHGHYIFDGRLRQDVAAMAEQTHSEDEWNRLLAEAEEAVKAKPARQPQAKPTSWDGIIGRLNERISANNDQVTGES